jgi:diguanylate cyclase (GGDEF)-like protein
MLLTGNQFNLKDKTIRDAENLLLFMEIGKSISSARTLRQVLEKLTREVGAVFSPLNWSLQLVDRKTGELVFVLVVGEASDKLKGTRFPMDEGLAGWIIRNRQAVIVGDVEKDRRFTDKLDKLAGFKTESIIGVPVQTENRVLGVIELINKLDGSGFTPFELKVLSMIADFTAIAIEKAYHMKAIRRASRTDHLTGVLNRRSFDRVLARETERCRRSKSNLTVLMVDVNDFKKINDREGHLKGDAVLKECARYLKDNIRKIDYVARYGGDEFAVIMPDIDETQAQKARERILLGINFTPNGGQTPPYTVSIGVHTSGPAGLSELVSKTDIDLYKQKEKKYSIKVEESLLDTKTGDN